LVSDKDLDVCNTSPGLGLSLWTAGHVAHDRTNSSDWQLYSMSLDGSNITYWIHNRMNFNYWHQGQPDNGGGQGENCVVIWANQNYEWNDADCSNTYCFVCENRNINT